ncbi:MAG: aminoacyl-tRNA hydrolase [Armatimonadota bacterium]
MFRKRTPDLVPVRLIVGLGNPGPEYAGTRHNVGWEVVEELASRAKIKLDRAKHRGRYGVGTLAGEVVALVKPLTYMNLSGQSVKGFLREFGLTPEALVVIADDLDMATGKVRLREAGSHGGHNGHRDLIARLQTDRYARLKIGIGSVHKSETIDHVLSHFDEAERGQIDRAVQKAADAVEVLITQGMPAALTFANTN